MIFFPFIDSDKNLYFIFAGFFRSDIFLRLVQSQGKWQAGQVATAKNP
jgi:hypothetical protein